MVHAATKTLAFVNGSFLPYDEASLHISDLAIQRGYGVFDFIKVQGEHPLFLDDYLSRFYSSAEALSLLVPYSDAELRKVIHRLLDSNKLETSGLKLILTGGYSPSGYEPVKPNLIIQQQPLVLPSSAMVENGISIITHEYVRELPTVKTINYSIGIMLLKEMKEKQADEVLYVKNSQVTEFPRCNLFIVNHTDEVITPANNVLLGVTRKNVLALANKKYHVNVRDLTIEEVYTAKEAFLTSTTKRILPITKINGSAIGNGKPGSITIDLLNDLIQLEKSYLKEVTKVI